MVTIDREALREAQTPRLRLIPESTAIVGVYTGRQYLGTVEADGTRWVWSCGDCLATSGYRWASAWNAAALLAAHQERHDVEQVAS